MKPAYSPATVATMMSSSIRRQCTLLRASGRGKEREVKRALERGVDIGEAIARGG